VAALLLIYQRLQAGEAIEGLKLAIGGPVETRAGKPVQVTFVVENEGENEGFYFKRPWKWASNGMRVVAVGADGVEHTSGALLFCIMAEYACTYFKPLFPGETYSFSESITFKVAPGHYKLRWVYEPAVWEEDQKCSVADVPIWKGHAESPEVALIVRE
jgi:hypothetical protein